MDQKIENIIANVLEGTASEPDRKILMDWIVSSPENQKELEQTEAFWNALEILSNHEKFNPTEGYENFIQQIEKPATHDPKIRQSNFLNYILRIAAIFLIVFGISYFTYRITKSSTDPIAYFELTTPNGSHTQLTLTDGTKIWLNAGSKLRYPNKFEGPTRTIHLEGEAYFNVKKDPKHPFIVQTSDVSIKALGTSFNVKAYPNEGSIETTLVNGIVVISGNKALNNEEPIVELKPKQKATFIKTTGKLLLNGQDEIRLKKTQLIGQAALRNKESLIVSKEVDTELYTSWIENRLVFDNETFESIAFKLERRYGATILFKNQKIKKIRFSGKFPEISIESALNALQYASSFDYEIKKDTIYIDN